MALFELDAEWVRPTFQDCAAADIDFTFFNGDEHAAWHRVDGREVLVVLQESTVKTRDPHWEGGAKQNLDTGLYTAQTVLYIKVEDYGAKPKVGKELVLDDGTNHRRTFAIRSCEEEFGVYRMTMERTRQ